jgi:hypothetical protein
MKRTPIIYCPICNKATIDCNGISCQKCTSPCDITETDICGCMMIDILQEFQSQAEDMRVERNVALREHNRIVRTLIKYFGTNSPGEHKDALERLLEVIRCHDPGNED